MQASERERPPRHLVHAVLRRGVDDRRLASSHYSW